MNEINKIVADIQTVFAQSTYPVDFLEAYDQMECLASHSGRETFLVRRKADGKEVIAKCFDRNIFPSVPEFDRLKSFDDPGLPKYYEEFRNGKTLCYVREYIEGTPLNKYFREKRPDLKEILDISDKLCAILEKLHSQNPPLIHRDVKPENIIVKPDGGIVLIDFDIARSIRDDTGTDTMIFGTKGYAPPEQYGFEQTGQRADIYSFGVLLRWMVTGSIQPNRNIRIDPGVQHVIDKCTAFSPDDRYADIKSVRMDLQSAGKKRRCISGRQMLVLAACALLFCISGFLLGRFTDIFKPGPAPVPTVVFSEPLIEKAVRLQLGLDENTALKPEDLRNVRTLYIYGTEAYADQEEFFLQDKAFHKQGTIHSLNDLTLLPELERFFMVYQGQVNISALSRLENLRYIELKHMRLEDIYPLGDLKMLRGAVLFDVGLRDVTPLEECHWLETLDVGKNPITSMQQIGTYPYLTSLSLRDLKMDSLDGIENYVSLKGLTLAQAEIKDFSAIRFLPQLETVYVADDLQQIIMPVIDGTDIKIELTDS